jgi:hypothetical protein
MIFSIPGLAFDFVGVVFVDTGLADLALDLLLAK